MTVHLPLAPTISHHLRVFSAADAERSAERRVRLGSDQSERRQVGPAEQATAAALAHDAHARAKAEVERVAKQSGLLEQRLPLVSRAEQQLERGSQRALRIGSRVQRHADPRAWIEAVLAEKSDERAEVAFGRVGQHRRVAAHQQHTRARGQE